jgi:hypothetical protein
MQRRLFEPSSLTVISVVLATISLAACGPGVGSSATPDTTSAPSQPQYNAALQPTPAEAGSSGATLASSIGTAAPADAANPASYAYASDPVQSVQASLAADNQQVAPVMSYAPGDEPPQAVSSTGNSTSTTDSTDSRSTATTRQ